MFHFCLFKPKKKYVEVKREDVRVPIEELPVGTKKEILDGTKPAVILLGLVKGCPPGINREYCDSGAKCELCMYEWIKKNPD